MTIVRLAALTVVVLIAVTVAGPTADAQGFGIKGGPIFTQFTSDLDFNNKTGPEVGIFFGGSRSRILGFQGEVNWLRKQGETQGNNVRIDYIQLPALLRLNIGTQSAGGFAFYGLGGAGVNIKIGDELEGINVNDAFKSVDIPLIFGGGMEISRLIFEGRFEQGLLRLDNNLGTSSIKNRTFAILVGFRFK